MIEVKEVGFFGYEDCSGLYETHVWIMDIRVECVVTKL